MINCYAFASVPPFAQGLVRDLRVRWALEEAALPYKVTLVGDGKGLVSRDEYRKLQPFGQIPAIEDGSLRLFESGAILVYLGERSARLLPTGTEARAEVLQWLFAALNSIEPAIQELAAIDLFYSAERWAAERRPGAALQTKTRLGELEAALGKRDFLAADFSIADIMMVSVLRIVRHTDLLQQVPGLAAYQKRCEARPAFTKALAGQMGDFQSAAA